MDACFERGPTNLPSCLTASIYLPPPACGLSPTDDYKQMTSLAPASDIPTEIPASDHPVYTGQIAYLDGNETQVASFTGEMEMASHAIALSPLHAHLY